GTVTASKRRLVPCKMGKAASMPLSTGASFGVERAKTMAIPTKPARIMMKQLSNKRRFKMRLTFLHILRDFSIVLVLFMGASLVLAHGSILRTAPIDNTALNESPGLVEVWFTEPIVEGTGQIDMITGNGETIAVGEITYNPAD